MTAAKTPTPDAPAAPATPGRIELDTPIRRGASEIACLTLRKPASGELRGLTLTDLLQMNVNALQTVIPRISDPALTPPEVAAMDPADLVQCGAVVAGFLLTKRDTANAYPSA